MPKAKSQNREIARKLWINSKGKMKLKDIAANLEISESQVRKWKSQDKWEDQKPKRVAAPGKKLGAPKGNTNAKGNKGGGAPKGNKNAVTHGMFEKIFFDTLSEEELTLISSIESNKIALLEKELALLTVREYRIMKRIEETRTKAFLPNTISTKKVKDGAGEPLGDEVVTHSISNLEALNKLEEALTKIQDKKIRTVEAISRIEIATARLQMDRGDEEEHFDGISSWIEATTPNHLDELFADERRGEENGVQEE